MIIEDTRNRDKHTFGDLKAGDVFYYHEHLYMKTNHYTVDTATVSLETGRLFPFLNEDEVILVNAKIIID